MVCSRRLTDSRANGGRKEASRCLQSGVLTSGGLATGVATTGEAHSGSWGRLRGYQFPRSWRRYEVFLFSIIA